MASSVLGLAALLLISAAASAQTVVLKVVPGKIGTNQGPMPAWAWIRGTVEAQEASLHKFNSTSTLMGSSQNVSPGANFGDFTVTVGVGTPAQNQRMSISMARGLSWFPSSTFRPARSSSFRRLSCADKRCWPTAKGESSIPDACAGRGSAAKSCRLDVISVDGSASTGDLVSEQASFGRATKSAVLGMNVNRGQVGILALGRSPNNVAYSFGGRFSYSPPIYSPKGARAGSLCLGADCTAPHGVVTPARATLLESAMFAVNFQGLSVGRLRLPALRAGVETVVDGGILISKLVPQAYQTLKTAFLKVVGGRVPLATSPVQTILDTCFNVTGKGRFTFPTVTLHFGKGGDVVLPRVATLAEMGPGLVCLAFTVSDSTPPINVIGSFQLQGLTLAVDLKTQTMGFAPNAPS